MQKLKEQFSFQYQENDEIRLDKFLALNLNKNGYSRIFITNLINQGQVAINNNVILSQKKILKKGDVVVININVIDEKNKMALVPTKMEIPIIYEDDDLIVVNKPNNLVVHPGSGNFDNTLINGLIFNMKKLSSVNEKTRPGIIHRLDKQTTGLLIVAKNNRSHYFLSQELKNHQIIRKYIALVHGTIKTRTGTIDAPIARDKHNRLKMTVNEENSRAAITHFKVIENFKNYTLITCQLETGRTHQIRVHLQWINHPVVNDPLYSKFLVEDDNLGQYLHAYKITFIHPTTKKIMTFKSDLPDFFENKLQLLRKESS